ncbi:MAG: hypothetical protein KBT88_02020 [Gammaproteobacteria bacterium]|nr:hypothetical protein [Gammaproteobacteria bacterium]MBQ0838535.1 hypothetical protein [Gammaproteobacteria bacterium]
MMDKMFSAMAVCLLASFFTLLYPAQLSAEEQVSPPSAARLLEVIVVKGAQLPALLDKAMSNYSLMAVRHGKLVPIPYQFDDLNTGGRSYVKGGVLNVDGKAGIVEAIDELVFMYKDMGVQASEALRAQSSGTVISELQINDNNSVRYAYLVAGNPERSDKVYSHYDMNTGLVTAESYSLQLDPDNLLILSDWIIKDFGDASVPTNVLDTLKMRVKGKLGFSATVDNEEIPAKALAVKNGPVRTIVEADTSIRILGISIASGTVSATFSAQTIKYPVFITLPKAAGTLSSLAIDLTLDYVDFDGSRYRTALGPKEPMITGTKQAATQRDLYKSDLANPWVSISSGNNWDMFLIFSHQDNFKPTLNAIYRDASAGDKAKKPERFKGSNSEIGISLSDIPVGIETSLNYNFYFGAGLWQGDDVDETLDELMNPAVVSVKAL